MLFRATNINLILYISITFLAKVIFFTINCYSSSTLFIFQLLITIFETYRITNIPMKINSPVNKIVKFIPNGLNQESLGGVINLPPNTTEKIMLMICAIRINGSLIFLIKSPVKITNNIIPVNKNGEPFGN